jgi:thiosulfate/3-mercaptopyruvate sulfurtransferase
MRAASQSASDACDPIRYTSAMSNPSLVSPDWLEAHLDDPDIRIVEVSAAISGEAYAAGHIPGAQWWYWKDLCWHETDREFVTPGTLAERLGGRGIPHDATLVLYGDPVQFGTYPFWALTMAGHRDLLLLDGTRTRWRAEGRPMTAEIAEFEPVVYEAHAGDTSMRVGRDDVRANLDNPDRLLLDLRSPEEYSGERVSPYGDFDHGAERFGRIPGARHLYYADLLNDDESFKSTDELMAVLAAAGVPDDRDQEIACYCRLSHRASLAWFVLTFLLGYRAVRVYDGSWTEWGSIVGFPIER